MPDQKIVDETFANIQLELEPYSKELFLTEKVQHALAKLFAYYEAGERYLPLKTTSAGELLVSSEGGQVSSGTTTQVSVNDTATLILASNADRREVVIENMGLNDCYIGFDNAITTATGFLLSPGTVFSTDKYVGDIYAIRSAASSCDVSVMEL